MESGQDPEPEAFFQRDTKRRYRLCCGDPDRRQRFPAGRQSQVAFQGYILSAALSIAGIPHQVTGFCTLGAYTILTLFRDFDEDRELDQRIFEFYGSANNRDGLAVKAAAAGLDQRKEENKILILLSDGRPNDIMAGSQNPGYTLPRAKKPEKEPYCLDFALRDTAEKCGS